MELKPETEHQVEGAVLSTGNKTKFPRKELADSNMGLDQDPIMADGSNLEEGLHGDLSDQHRDYLIARHGTVDLNPLPTMDPADPLNWPAWKVFLPTSNPFLKTNDFRKTLIFSLLHSTP